MDHEAYQELIGRGVTLMATANYEKAKGVLQQAIEMDPTQKDAYFHMGNANANLELFDNALHNFERVVEIDPDDGEAYFAIGNLYILKGDLLKCVEAYNMAEGKGFKSVELYSNLAAIYMEMQEPMQAIRTLAKGIKLEPMRPDLRIEKAKMYIASNRFAEALDTLKELQSIFPDAFEAYDLQTQIYMGMKRYDEALAIISGAVERFDEDVVLRWIKIKVLVEMGAHDDALKEIAAARRYPDYETVAREVALQEAIIYSVKNDMSATIKALEGMLDYEREGTIDGQGRFMLMNVYYGQNDYDNAMKHAKALAALQDNSLFCISGRYYIAQIMKMQGQIEAAHVEMKRLTVELRRLTIQEPTFYEAYMYRLLSHKEIGEFDKALELADYMEALFPDRADGHAFRSLVYADMGEPEKAAAERQKAKSLNPDLMI